MAFRTADTLGVNRSRRTLEGHPWKDIIFVPAVGAMVTV
jgi:hypothetical protein